MKDNPFRFGAPVEGAYYFARPHLQASCDALLGNAISIMLLGPRRFGKTSFAKNFCRHWKEAGRGDAILIDVYSVTSHQDFLLQILRPLQSRQNILKKMAGWIRKNWPHSVTLGNDSVGNITLAWLSDKNEQEKKLFIQQAFEALAELDGNVCFVIDECQQIAKESLGDGGWLEATLRQYIQSQTGKVSYLLTGSRRDIVHAMVNDNSRPLYRACQLIDFPPLGEDFTNWVIARFKTIGVSCNAEAIRYLRACVNDSPNYVQMVCHQMASMECENIESSTIDKALMNIVSQAAYSYETHLQNLSTIQQRVLRMLALEDGGYYSEVLLKRYEISSKAHVTNAINVLKKQNILDQDAPGRGRVAFDDPLFKLWLRYKFGNYQTVE